MTYEFEPAAFAVDVLKGVIRVEGHTKSDEHYLGYNIFWVPIDREKGITHPLKGQKIRVEVTYAD
jgi:hypothetical protein